ncbi:hypothetical protein [Streptomyces sp. NPDC094049]|uniref:hypothetical protein n=1 Tax=Streptomyces sp. NPDC094049 TaxID=3154987 RepID=UPI00332E0DBC
MKRTVITVLASAALSLAAIIPAAANNIEFLAYEDPAHPGKAKVLNAVNGNPQANDIQWDVCKNVLVGRDLINDTGGTAFLYEHEDCTGSYKHKLDDTEEAINMPTKSIRSVKIVR